MGPGAPPQSISTVAFGDSAVESFLMIATLRLHYPDLPILVVCEPGLFDRFRKTGLPTRGLRFIPQITAYERSLRAKWVERFYDLEPAWDPAGLTYKMDAVSNALHRFSGTLFVDSDILFFEPPLVSDEPFILSEHQSGLEVWERKVGRFNAGFIGVRELYGFPSWWWHSFSETSRFFEQACLEEAAFRFEAVQFPNSENVGFWSCPSLWFRARSLHTHMLPGRRAHYPEPFNRLAENLAEVADRRLREELGLGDLLDQIVCGKI
jgi:hypothetical protein